MYRLAADQDGLLTRANALAAGVPSGTLTGWVRRQRLQTVHRGVYAVAGATLGPRERARAAVLAVGHPAAAASHQTAAIVHGIGVLAAAGAAHVTLPTAVHRSSRTALVVHRTDPGVDEIVDLDGLRVTTVSRTVQDLLIAGDRLGAVWACEAALRLGSLHDARPRRAGRPMRRPPALGTDAAAAGARRCAQRVATGDRRPPVAARREAAGPRAAISRAYAGRSPAGPS